MFRLGFLGLFLVFRLCLLILGVWRFGRLSIFLCLLGFLFRLGLCRRLRLAFGFGLFLSL